MIYNYEECLALFGSNYFIKKAIKSSKIFKLKNGLYSTEKKVKDIDIFIAKHKNFVFTMESALYYHGISDVVPDLYVIATDKDATKYKDSDIKQYFMNNGLINIGATVIRHNNIDIPVFDKERMLIEVIRYKNKLPFDYYKEVISYYRSHLYDIDFSLVLDYLRSFPKKQLLEKTIQLEVL
ncbi:MAG: hypothetical protein K6E11_04220 [Bacilli bacterium]|nr:hypothetical protein [Bacilli bacterium]